MPRKLLRMKINRVDLVDRGANQHAEIVLTKRAVQKDSPTDVHVDVPVKPAAKKPKQGEKPVGKNLLKRMLAAFGETDVTKRAAELEELGKAIDAEGEEKPAEKPAEKAADVQDPTINKRFEELQAKNVELQKRADEAVAVAKAERESRLEREMTDVLKSFKATPFVLEGEDNDVTKFRKMREDSPALYDRTIALFKAADAQLAQSALFKQYGTSAPAGANSAWAQIEAKADQLIEKSAGSLSREAAINKVMDQNPKLVSQYRSEQQ